MKKKLFALALIVSLYSVFTLAFTSFDNQGKITAFLNEPGFSKGEAIAATTFSSDSGTMFRTTMPKPKKPTPTRPSAPPSLN